MKNTINLIFRCVALAMGVAVVVLNILGKLDTNTAITLLGIGLATLSISFIDNGKKE